MPYVDLIAGALIVVALAWGSSAGFPRSLIPAAFMTGAVVAAVATPLLLGKEKYTSGALVFTIPAALILGALLAARIERPALRLARRHRSLSVPSRIGGGLLAGSCALAAACLIGAVVAQEGSLRERIEQSEIVGRLDDVLEPPGPAGAPERRNFDPFPIISGPR